MADTFTFKQFTIHQDRCGMKVGTDGVLLGAWAEGGKNILDIGCGTGIISIMMAQRFANSAILGIDIDSAACEQAIENATQSPYAKLIKVLPITVQTLAQNSEPFQAIVCNPPFFVNSLKSKGASRTMARHTDTLSFQDLFRCVNKLLSAEGVFSAIIPDEQLSDFLSESYFYGLNLMRHTKIKTTINKPTPKRHLLEFRKDNDKEYQEEMVFLTDAKGEKSQWYDELTKDFYL